MLAMLLLLAALVAHPNSQSSSRVVVEGRRIELELVCQTRSLVESVPVDTDGNVELDERELDAGRDAVLRYVAEHYVIAPPNAAALVLQPVELIALPHTGFDEQRLRARFVAESPLDLTGLELEVTLFAERNPLHRDAASVVWNGDEPTTWLFGEGVTHCSFEPASRRRPGVFGSFVHLGVEHILIGYDHIAFLIALIVASRRVRSLTLVVTAFTLAHSITLACAATGIVSVPSRLVEIAIALSIAYVGTENLIFRRPATRWPEAFLFGLVHGLGFASVLEESLLVEPLKITALVGFNVGVELGQLAIVVAVALALRWLPGDRALESETRAWFAPRWLRLGASTIVAVLGLYWFAQRSGWINGG